MSDTKRTLNALRAACGARPGERVIVLVGLSDAQLAEVELDELRENYVVMRDAMRELRRILNGGGQ